MNRIIVSSASLFKMLGGLTSNTKDQQVLITVKNKRFSISGLDSYLDIEPENDFTVSVDDEKLRWLFKLLRNISDQPLTLKFNEWNDWIEIENVII